MDRTLTSSDRTWLPETLLAVLLAAILLFVLSCKVFPSQDGPMHRYYIHVLDSLLRHSGEYPYFQIRHPFPPYLTQYALMLVLSHLFSFDLAEKLLVCLTVLCLAMGLRSSGMQMGPAGRWVVLLSSPLLLPWCLWKGSFNYTLGVGLMFIATAFWQRLAQRRPWSLFAFTVVVALLTVTHPIPLLLLILLCALDLTFAVLLRPAATTSATAWLSDHRPQLIGLALLTAAAVIPARARDTTQTQSTLSLFGFHHDVFRLALELYGLSPYSPRSHALWINAYRLCLYSILLWAMWTGARAALSAWRRRQPSFALTVLVATVALAVAIPILPNYVNGSAHFADRLIVIVWFGALLAASAGEVPRPQHRLIFIGAAVLCCLLTLIPAWQYLFPISRDLERAERGSFPRNAKATVLVGSHLPEYESRINQIAFDPYEWAPVTGFVQSNVILLNPPWINQNILPIQARDGSPLYIAPLESAHWLLGGTRATGEHYLPEDRRDQLTGDSQLLVYVGTPDELSHQLKEQLSPGQASQFTCEPRQRWYIVCSKR